jgi:hypothetical protein
MPIQIHSHQLNRKTVTGILITWKSGMITCIQKTADTMDMLVYEFDDIEDVTFIDMIVCEDKPVIDTKADSKPQQSRGTGGFRYIGTYNKSIESFIQESQNFDELEIGDTVCIGEAMYKCTSIDPLEFEMVARSGGAQW